MIVANKVILREKRLADAWDNYTWATDPELAQLDAAPLVTSTFSQYLSNYINELRNPFLPSHQFAIDAPSGKHIGNCVFYNISEIREEAELGIMIGNRDYWDKGCGTDAVTTLVNHIFSQTNIRRIYLKTLELNSRAQKCFQKCSFTPYGHLGQDGFNFVLMEIYYNHWQEQQTKA
ncbi:GNAT family N-acetyltransferase [Chloroflexota bacterium]